MENLSMEWPSSVILLEPLRPLSPEILDHEKITKLDINVDIKLSRSEIAGKLLEQLDELHEESEPFDWFSNEKSIDLPIFETLTSPVPYKFENYVKPIHNYSFPVDSVKCELSSPVPKDVCYDAAQTPPVYASPSIYDVGAKTVAFDTNGAAAQPQPSLVVSPEWLKSETLTPPDSPKDEDILKMLQDLEPEDLEQLVMARVDDFNSSMTPFSENSCSNDDDFSEYGGSSPCVASDSGLDDPEWSPSSNMKQSSSVKSRNNGGAAKRRNSKPYTKPCVEDRKVRKKEQNKNAATRYRLKKKAESQEIKQEEQILQEYNDKLRNQLEDINREVRYLKSLMREVYRKKGLIK